MALTAQSQRQPAGRRATRVLVKICIYGYLDQVRMGPALGTGSAVASALGISMTAHTRAVFPAHFRLTRAYRTVQRALPDGKRPVYVQNYVDESGRRARLERTACVSGFGICRTSLTFVVRRPHVRAPESRSAQAPLANASTLTAAHYV